MRVIRENPFLELVGATGDGQEGVRLCERLRPDLVLLDIGLPGLNGIEVLQRLKKLDSRIFVIVFTSFTEPRIIQNALRAGADSFLEKNVSLEELEKALKLAESGQPYFSAAAMSAMRSMLQNPKEGGPLDVLTSREKEVLQLIAESHTTKEISSKLGLSIGTINTHRWNLMRKLKIHDAAGLTRFAMEHGLTRGKHGFGL